MNEVLTWSRLFLLEITRLWGLRVSYYFLLVDLLFVFNNRGFFCFLSTDLFNGEQAVSNETNIIDFKLDLPYDSITSGRNLGYKLICEYFDKVVKL